MTTAVATSTEEPEEKKPLQYQYAVLADGYQVVMYWSPDKLIENFRKEEADVQ